MLPTTDQLSGLNDTAKQAVIKCFATKGPYKGYITKGAPNSRTLAYAARQAMLMVINPYKVSIGGTMFLDDPQQVLYTAVYQWVDSLPVSERVKFDKDRYELQSLGVWY